MSLGKKKWISIMIVPEDGSGMRKWRITARRFSLLKTALWGLCFSLIVSFVSVIVLTVMFGKLQHYRELNEQLLKAT